MSASRNVVVKVARKIGRAYRVLTADIRTLPSFLIIGAAKCGTTSLYNYLIQHPKIAASSKKEIHYFDYRFDQGVRWYRSFFAIGSASSEGNSPVTGEASPTYLYHPHAAARAKQLLPDALIICMLRNPVDRAISSYHNQVRIGLENLSLAEAIDQEAERIAGQEEKLSAGQESFLFEHKYYAYARRGVYADQLERWFACYKREQFVFINSEEFFSDPRRAYGEVVSRLGLPEFELQNYRAFNTGGGYDDAEGEIRRKLTEYFRPHNERLYSLLGVRYDWDA